jgi:hypothetical protein
VARKRTRLGGPSFAIAECASLDELAWHWADRRGIDVGAVDGAQRRLEISIRIMPVNARAYCQQWFRTVRRWVALGRDNPRAGLLPRGYWVTWLAERGLSQGDLLSDEQWLNVRTDLQREARPMVRKRLAAVQQAWLPAKPVGLRGYALVVTREPDGMRVDIVATRERAALLDRQRSRMRARREAAPDMAKQNNVRQRDRARRAKSEIRKRLQERPNAR